MSWTEGLKRMACGLRGHDTALHFERHRLSLRCLSCGHETTGWSLQSETRHGASATDDFSQSRTSGIELIETIVGVFPSRRNRSHHATT